MTASTGRASRRRRHTHFQRAPRMPVVMPADLMPEPPECAADEATPAGTALAPLRPASPGRRPLGRALILWFVTEIVTDVNRKGTAYSVIPGPSAARSPETI